MPSPLNSTPNFTKDDIQGWNTRLIFSQNLPTNLDLTSYNYFDEVSPSLTRGTLGRFPRGYWSEGRILRLKANLTYGNALELNIDTEISDGTNGLRCRSDDGNIHEFAGGNQPSGVPVNLEITYVKGPGSEFSMSGFYQYEWGSYQSGGANSKVIYVPMNYVNDVVIDFAQTTGIGLVIGNGNVTVNWMTLEELG